MIDRRQPFAPQPRPFFEISQYKYNRSERQHDCDVRSINKRIACHEKLGSELFN
jgi:hypothetical protein